MLKISDAVRAIIFNNNFLNFGIHYRLLNLSQVARFIAPLVADRTKKEVSDSAVLMSLSRIQQSIKDQQIEKPQYFLDRVSINGNLCSLTLPKTQTAHAALGKVFAHIQKQGGFFTMTEGMSEITVILSNDYTEEALKALDKDKPHRTHRPIASVTAKFSPQYLETPGLLYRILHQVTMQNINLIEVASTATEFSVFLKEEDVELAFDSIYNAFVKRGRQY